MTKDIVPVTEAGTASMFCVLVIDSCALDSYIVVDAHWSVILS